MHHQRCIKCTLHNLIKPRQTDGGQTPSFPAPSLPASRPPTSVSLFSHSTFDVRCSMFIFSHLPSLQASKPLTSISLFSHSTFDVRCSSFPSLPTSQPPSLFASQHSSIPQSCMSNSISTLRSDIFFSPMPGILI